MESEPDCEPLTMAEIVKIEEDIKDVILRKIRRRDRTAEEYLYTCILFSSRLAGNEQVLEVLSKERYREILWSLCKQRCIYYSYDWKRRIISYHSYDGPSKKGRLLRDS